MIRQGIKKEEYREIGGRNDSLLAKDKKLPARIAGFKHYDYVKFHFYRETPQIIVECKEIRIGKGKKEWGAEEGKLYYVISLGEIVQITTKHIENQKTLF